MRVLIIGIVASGKTTLAKNLSKKSGIKHYELDLIVHDDFNNIKRTTEEQKAIIKDICNENDDWIIEGTLRKNMDFLLGLADKIVLIDIPLYIRKKRIIIRYVKQKLKLEACGYKPSLKMVKMMYKWTRNYEDNKKDLMKKLLRYEDKLTILDTVKKVNSYDVKR